MDFLLSFILLAAVFVGLGVGASCAPNVVGVLQDVLSWRYRRVTSLLAFFIILGGILQAHGISNTVGREIVPTEEISGNLRVLCVLFLSTGFIALVLTFLEVPISISQIMVGSVLGVGLALGILESMHYDVVAKIILSWIATPIASCVLTNLLYNLIVIPLSARLTFISFNRLCVILTIFGAMFMSYDIGANDIGVILGPLVASGLFKELNFAGLVVSPVFLLSAFIGVVAGVGALFLGEPVAYTIGKKITVLDPMSSFSSQLGAGMVIYFFILLGIPISTGQAIVGGIFGVGLAKGMNLIGRKTMRKIIVWWITTPLIALVLSALLYRIIIIF